MRFEVWYGVFHLNSLHDILKDFMVLVAFSVPRLLFGMRLTCQLEVDSLRLGREESLLKQVDELLFRNGLEYFQLLFLPIELVLVRTQFTPMSRILFPQVDVLLRQLHHYSLLLNLKVLV